MNNISRADLKRLHRIVNSSDSPTSANTGVVKSLYADYGIGIKVSKCYIRFDALDKPRIKNLILKIFDIDLTKELTGDRISYAAKAGQEKLATIAPKALNVELRSLSGELLLNGKTISLLSPSSSLVADLNEIESIDHGVVIIVENYTAFKRLTRNILPKSDEFNDPLIAYRGDGERASIDNLIKRLGTKTYSWMDFDPQGFNLALAKKEFTAGTLLPSNPSDLFKKNYGKSESFNKQIRFVEKLRNSDIEWVGSAIELMCNNSKVLTQEGTILEQQELKLASFI